MLQNQNTSVRLLIVDDDLSLCKSLKEFFLGQGYSIEVAHDGPSALERVGTFRPHLMFLDIGLPGLSGIEVLKAAKEIDQTVRVIMITGQSEKEFQQQTRVLGADDYVTKPFTLDYLRNEVMEKLHKYLVVELHATSVDLAVEREKLDLLFEQMQDGIVLFDMSAFAHTANAAARNWLRLPEGSFHVKTSEVFKEYGKMRELPDGFTLEKRLTVLENFLDRKVDLIREQPSHLILECSIRPFLSRDRQKSGYMALLHDVTFERKSLNAMTKFISLMNHKLRTPLVAIQAYPPMMLAMDEKTHAMSEAQRNAWGVVAQQSERLMDSLTEMLVFSTMDKTLLQRDSFMLLDLVKESIALLPAEVKSKSDAIECLPSLESRPLQGDRKLLALAFCNLIENAFKFGGSRLVIQEIVQPDLIKVSFTDNGPGIPPEDRERIFEKFYQVETAYCGQVSGPGLGLTMVREIIQAHDGHVLLRKTSPQGSEFVVELPTNPI